MEQTQIPNKVFYKIGEVAKFLGVEPYVLRYWEGEFNLRLTKSKNRQRLYQKKDIDQLERIKTLLYDEKFTIAGAKRRLRERRKNEGKTAGNDAQLPLKMPVSNVETRLLKETLAQVRNEIQALLEVL